MSVRLQVYTQKDLDNLAYGCVSFLFVFKGGGGLSVGNRTRKEEKYTITFKWLRYKLYVSLAFAKFKDSGDNATEMPWLYKSSKTVNLITCVRSLWFLFTLGISEKENNNNKKQPYIMLFKLKP